MVFEHVNFNEEHWKGKTLKEFQEHEAHHGLSKEQLKEAFDLINAKKKDAAEEVVK